jgi:hypothetical protein
MVDANHQHPVASALRFRRAVPLALRRRARRHGTCRAVRCPRPGVPRAVGAADLKQDVRARHGVVGGMDRVQALTGSSVNRARRLLGRSETPVDEMPARIARAFPRSYPLIRMATKRRIVRVGNSRGFGFPSRSSTRRTCPKKSKSMRSRAGWSSEPLPVLGAGGRQPQNHADVQR